MIVLGEVANNGGSRLEGWCWSPDRPAERRVIGIYVNGILATSAVAARMNTEARDMGIGDGYCGFSVPFPLLPSGEDGPVIIEARERQTGATFGHIIIGDDPAQSPFRARLSHAEAGLQDISHRVAQFTAPSGIRSLSAALHMLGVSLMSRPLRMARPLPPPDMSLPWVPRPRFSLIFPARPDWKETRDAFRGLSAPLKKYEAEIILLDDGNDPATPAAASQIRNLGYIFHPGGVLARLNAGVLEARGRTICVLSGAASSPRSLLDIFGTLPENPFILGHQPASLAHEFGYAKAWQSEIHAAAAANLHLLVDKDLFADAGAFDEQLTSPPLSVLDFALKASLLGHAPILWQARETAHVLFSAGPTYESRTALLERWPI